MFISGAMARAGRNEHRAEADAIDLALIDRYNKTTDVAELSHLIEALGNSVGPKALPVIKKALRDPRPTLRAAAVRGLRLAAGSEIDILLAQAIVGDSDPKVRADAIFAAGFRRPLATALGEAAVHAARFDETDYVRSGAVSLLRSNPDAVPQVSQTLAWVSEHDAKPGIRRLAQDASQVVSAKRSAPVTASNQENGR